MVSLGGSLDFLDPPLYLPLWVEPTCLIQVEPSHHKLYQAPSFFLVQRQKVGKSLHTVWVRGWDAVFFWTRCVDTPTVVHLDSTPYLTIISNSQPRPSWSLPYLSDKVISWTVSQRIGLHHSNVGYYWMPMFSSLGLWLFALLMRF